MKTRLSIWPGLLALAAVLLAPGCATTQPGEDVVLVRAQQTRAFSLELANAFVTFEKVNQRKLLASNPAIHQAAETIRLQAPGWFQSFNDVMDAYKLTKSTGDKEKLIAWIAVVERLMTEVMMNLANAKEWVSPNTMPKPLPTK